VFVSTRQLQGDAMTQIRTSRENTKLSKYSDISGLVVTTSRFQLENIITKRENKCEYVVPKITRWQFKKTTVRHNI
jgi:hypothetical protein